MAKKLLLRRSTTRDGRMTVLIVTVIIIIIIININIMFFNDKLTGATHYNTKYRSNNVELIVNK